MPELYAHPFAAFCWKVLIALYERGVAFDYRHIGPDYPENQARLEALWPVAQFPVLADAGRTVIETSVIIEHLDLHHGSAPPMVPADPAAALDARMLDRIVDDYIAQPMQRIVADFIRVPAHRDSRTVMEAKVLLDKSYDWLDKRMINREWAAGDFGIAECAAAPALFYADWVHPIGSARVSLSAYRERLLARPSVARVVDEARPYRSMFPPGAPNRD
jgi:glutathione S-transferase